MVVAEVLSALGVVGAIAAAAELGLILLAISGATDIAKRVFSGKKD